MSLTGPYREPSTPHKNTPLLCLCRVPLLKFFSTWGPWVQGKPGDNWRAHCTKCDRVCAEVEDSGSTWFLYHSLCEAETKATGRHNMTAWARASDALDPRQIRYRG